MEIALQVRGPAGGFRIRPVANLSREVRLDVVFCGFSSGSGEYYCFTPFDWSMSANVNHNCKLLSLYTDDHLNYLVK